MVQVESFDGYVRITVQRGEGGLVCHPLINVHTAGSRGLYDSLAFVGVNCKWKKKKNRWYHLFFCKVCVHC